jgi:TldD protein
VELGRFATMFSGYTELRLQHNELRRVMLVNGSVVANQSVSRGGVSARVRDRGAWGFASDADTADAGVERVIRAATDNARWLGARGPQRQGELPSRAGGSVDRFNTARRRWTSAEVVDYLLELDRLIASRHPRLHSRTLSLSALDMAKALATSEGSESDSLIPRTILGVSLAMVRDGEPVRLVDTHGGFGQLEDVLTDPEAVMAAVGRQVAHLEQKRDAVHPRAGAAEVILDADLAGILAHEAIGHTTEADLVLGGSIAGPNLGKQIASPLVSLTDFANTAFGERCPVPVYVDDEGTLAVDVPLIADGVLKGFMHNKETALRFGVAPTGNARAFEFSDEPLVRMRNTSFLPGNSTLDEMIASVDDGYYLMRPSNGQADSTSEFMFGVVLGYEIKRGRIGRAIRDTTISGVAFDVLRTVSMVSGDISWQCGGMCGKKQPIPVGMGGPAIKCRVSLGGE